MRLRTTMAALVTGVALATASTMAVSAPAHAARATGAITMTLKSDLAYLVTDDHWMGVKPARVGIEPSGTPYPGPTVVFPVRFEDGYFKVHGKGALALGPGSILARQPVVSSSPDELAKGKARVSFMAVGNGSMAMAPFYVKNFETVGTDSKGFTMWMGDLHATKSKRILKDFNDLSGLTGSKALKPGQALGMIRVEVKAR